MSRLGASNDATPIDAIASCGAPGLSPPQLGSSLPSAILVGVPNRSSRLAVQPAGSGEVAVNFAGETGATSASLHFKVGTGVARATSRAARISSPTLPVV